MIKVYTSQNNKPLHHVVGSPMNPHYIAVFLKSNTTLNFNLKVQYNEKVKEDIRSCYGTLKCTCTWCIHDTVKCAPLN